MESYPIPKENRAWLGTLIYTDDKIEEFVEVINDLELQPEMAAFLYYGTTGAPDYTLVVLFSSYYIGTADAGKSALSKFYDIGPVEDATAWTPYNGTNAGSSTFCIKGGWKPTYGSGLSQMVLSTWRSIWNQYLAFLENLGTGSSIVLLEAYSIQKVRSISSSSPSYPIHQTVKFQAAVLPWYDNSSLYTEAVVFASKVRDLWRSTDGLAHNKIADLEENSWPIWSIQSTLSAVEYPQPLKGYSGYEFSIKVTRLEVSSL